MRKWNPRRRRRKALISSSAVGTAWDGRMAGVCSLITKLLAEASGSGKRCYLQGLTAPKDEHAAAQWAQSELFFRLLLKNTVGPLHQAAYAYFWRVSPLFEEEPIKSIQVYLF